MMDTSKRSKIIYMWKKQGLVHNDYKGLYEQYINNHNCQFCGTEYKSRRDRCLDHEHDTGLFRMFLCQKCNVHDSYIKYPNGYVKGKSWQQNNKQHVIDYKKNYYESNKETIKQQNSEKVVCECGSIVSSSNLPRHKKSKKHLDLVK